MPSNAPIDENDVKGLIAASSTDGATPVKVYADPDTHRLLVDIPGGSGTVTEVDTGTGLTGGPITTTGTISLDTKLAPMDTLTGNSLKVLRVNAGETAVEYATPAAGTVTSVSGTADRITSTGGATPVIDIAATYVGQSSITTLGTISSGTWAGTAVAADHGGTGLSSLTQGDIIYSSAANTFSALAKNTSATRYLSNTGTSNNPAWAQIALSTGVTGTLPIANGGTNTTSQTTNGVAYFDSTKITSGSALTFDGSKLASSDTNLSNQFSSIFATTKTLAADSSQNYNALSGQAYLYPNSFAYTGTLIGASFTASGRGSTNGGSISVLYGLSMLAGVIDAQPINVTTARATWIRPANYGTGTITNLDALYIGAEGSGAVTTYRGIYLNDQAAATTAYGIYNAMSSGANKWGYYGAGTAQNYFGGTVTAPALLATANDSGALGASGTAFSDLFLASGGVINWVAGDYTLTHSSGVLTANKDLRITTVGTDATSVPTLGSTSTLTSKTLTSPTIQTSPVLAAATNLKYTVASADGTATGDITNEFNSGYSSTAIGDLVYLDSAATWQKAKADSATTSTNLLGIALSVTASGAAATVLLRGFVYAATPFPTFTIGSPVYISGATAGVVTQTAPSTTDYVIRIVGHAVHADKLWFNPSNDWITHT